MHLRKPTFWVYKPCPATNIIFAIMFRVLTLLCLVAPAAFGEETKKASSKQDVLWVKHTIDGKASIFSVPASLAEVKKRNWQKIDSPAKFSVSDLDAGTAYANVNGQSMYVVLAKDGLACGYVFGFEQKTISNMQTDFTSTGLSTYCAKVNGTEITYLATPVIISSCKKGVKRGAGLVENNAVYVLGENGVKTKFSTKISENKEYTKNKCVSGYGCYYFANMKSDVKCTKKTLVNEYLMADPTSGDVIGVGKWFVATHTLPKGKFQLTYDFKKADFTAAVSDPPTCLLKNVSKYGGCGYQFYFKNPKNIKC